MSEAHMASLERELAAGRRAREQIVRAVERGDAMRSSALV